MEKNILLGIFLFSAAIEMAFSIKCELFAPIEGKDEGPEMGIIFIPGAQIEGQAYAPITKKIQYEFPGRLWIGLTESWWASMPNPIQIGQAIDACFTGAE